MEFEKLAELSDDNKKQILRNLIKNDISYWKKILILMTMVEEDENTELLDMIIEHKIEEIKLANAKYNLGIVSENIKNELNIAEIFEEEE